MTLGLGLLLQLRSYLQKVIFVLAVELVENCGKKKESQNHYIPRPIKARIVLGQSSHIAWRLLPIQVYVNYSATVQLHRTHSSGQLQNNFKQFTISYGCLILTAGDIDSHKIFFQQNLKLQCWPIHKFQLYTKT